MSFKASFRPSSFKEWLRKVIPCAQVPLRISAYATIPLVVGLFLWQLSEIERTYFTTALGVIWVLFLGELAISVYIAPDRVAWLKNNWYLVLALIVPILRPLIILRFLFGAKMTEDHYRSSISISGLSVSAGALIFIAATIMFTIESRVNQSFLSISDAIWWTMATVSTVGYGDTVPITSAGRIVAIIVMISGVGIFGALAGNLSSYLTRKDEENQMKRQEQFSENLIEEMREIRKLLEGMKRKT